MALITTILAGLASVLMLIDLVLLIIWMLNG